MGGDSIESLSEEERAAEEAQIALRESLERVHEMICDARLIATAGKPKPAARARPRGAASSSSDPALTSAEAAPPTGSRPQ